MTSRKEIVPYSLSRNTLKCRGKHADEVKQEGNPDTRLYDNEHGRFSVFVNHEDPLILKKNRDLDEAYSNAVNDGTGIFQLREVSVFFQSINRMGTIATEQHT